MSEDPAEDNRFASVAETLEDADGEGDEDDVDADGSLEGDEPDAGTRSGAPFPFREVAQYPFYARKRSWEAAERTRADVESSLRERGIADVRKREFHDALLRVAAADPDAVADAIARARTED